MFLGRSRHLARLRSGLAGVAAVLVLALGLLAHAPHWHAWLHRHAAAEAEATPGNVHAACARGEVGEPERSAPADDSTPDAPAAVPKPGHHCAILAFAQGAELLHPVLLPAPRTRVLKVAHRGSTAAPRAARPAHLHPPPQAPPGLG